MREREFERRFMQQMTPQQRSAVRAVEGNVLLLAVPGSGKTTVLVTRLGYMVNCCGIAPDQILTMTYTVAATQEMRQRFARLFGEDTAARMEFRTINGLSARIIQWYSANVSHRPAFTLCENEGELNRLLRAAAVKAGAEYPTDSVIKDLRTAVTYCKNMLLSDEEIEERGWDTEGFPAVYKAYREALLERRWMDFDDQMGYALRILRSCPEVLAHFREQYRYLCVDEGQDTSLVQHRIIRLLCGEEGHVFMVGDEDQSIYGFRAAYPEALLTFERDYPAARVMLMEDNFRSTPEIVGAADAFVQRNTARHPKTLRASRPSGKPVRYLTLRSREAQYHYLLKVAQDCDRPTAVLYRNNDSALPLIDLLEKEKLPYRCRNFDTAFFTHPVVNDVRDFVRFAADTRDEECFFRIYYKLGLPISRKMAEEACRRSARGGKTILMELWKLPGLKDYTRSLLGELVENFASMSKMRGAAVIRHIWWGLGYRSYLLERKLDPGKYAILCSLASGLGDAEEVVAHLDELQTTIRDHVNEEGVPFLLSTVHSSKGLEYERVYLLDAHDGLLPSLSEAEARTEEEKKQYQEDRRLFYVAITRAKDELTLFSYPSNTSSFVRELREATGAPEEESGEKRPAAPASGGKSAGKKTGKKTPVEPKIGAAVVHKAFGEGTVTAYDGQVVTVKFRRGGSKRLLYRAVTEKGLLSFKGD